MSLLEVKDLTVRRGGKTIVESVSFALEAGEWLMLAGPNGAGKSTCVNAIAQCAPYTGEVLAGGGDARRMKPARLAREIAVLEQTHAVEYAFTVEEIVRMGRYAHERGFFSARGEGEAQVERALEATGLTALRGRSVLTLSGGETQRMFLAQAFAQEPRVLLLDEPTNHLDLKYQQQIFALIREWLKTPGRAVLSVVHDLSLARAFGTRALLLDGGRVAAQGAMETVFAPETLARVYGMDVYGWMRGLLGQWSGA